MKFVLHNQFQIIENLAILEYIYPVDLDSPTALK